MKIPFTLPFLGEAAEREVLSVLRSGWITTGPKVAELQQEFCAQTGFTHSLAVNSWTSGAALILKWFGIGPGDEVIVPAYTYCSTALVVLHAGATPVMVDVNDDFNMNIDALEDAITSRTKAIIPVDFAGWPVDYTHLQNMVRSKAYLFNAKNEEQRLLGRPLIIADAAHSIGALYNDEAAGLQADIAVYSFHAVKNITSAEGGMIGINLPKPFDKDEVYKWLRINTLNGQTKDAFTKSQGGNWRYDIISDGLKINMPDLNAAIALAQLKQYNSTIHPERKRVVDHYLQRFSHYEWAQCMPFEDHLRNGAYHLFPLRIKGISEAERDRIIDRITKHGIAVNVHFMPLPMLTVFKDLGYDISNYPVAYDNYSREISLPIYSQLTNDQVDTIVSAVEEAVSEVVLAH